MGKVVRKKHLNIIELLLQATEVTARLIEEKKLQDCLVLFTDCQESAVALGGHIEKLYGMNTKIVAILEQYCENLYQMSVALDEGVQVDAAYEALQQVTKQIKEVYIEEFPDKKEVVFLPYKAAMWDSLESVWKAADEDPDCDAYVIPIPYYDLDENGNFKEMHYEGDLYPKYVRITSYEEYDLEERHPDMIFIHNPYDEYNRVTRIEPKFFSSKIKDYTEKLVYIPYFVLGEIDPNDQVAIDGMCHFCYLPGTMYANKVIVQSENMRQIYINEYLKAAYAHGESVTREELEKRILGFGSPKFDKAVNTKKEELEIPEEWLRIIEKEDGSWKKIIFYNTSLKAFLDNSHQMLKKIKDVLRVFKENKDEVALLWRPHPLMLQTMESMRPKYIEVYKNIVKQYKEEGWGIYDDTSTMDKAVTISDGYYGDPSSVVQVYQETGKPVMLQDLNGKVQGLEEKKSLQFTSAVFKKNKMYFSAWNTNGLFSFDLENLRLKQENILPINPSMKQQFSKSILIENRLFLSPIGVDYILEIDIDTKEMTKYVLDKKFCGEHIGYQNIFVFERKLCFVPFFSRSFCCLDLDSKELTYHEEAYDSIAHKVKDIVFWRSGIAVRDEIWVAVNNTNTVISFNPRTNKTCKYEIGDSDLKFASIAHDGENYWIYTTTGVILKWNQEDGILAKIQLSISGCEKDGYIFFANNEIWFFANVHDIYAKINIKTNNVSIRKGYLPSNLREKIGYMGDVEIKENTLYICPNQSELFIKINLETEQVDIIPMMLTCDQYEDYKQKFVGCINDYDGKPVFVGADVMITYIVENMCKKTSECEKNNLGIYIYDNLMKQEEHNDSV